MKHRVAPFQPDRSGSPIFGIKRRQRGETLVETLVTVLIIALSAASLATAAMVSHRIAAAADTRAAELNAAQTAAAEQAADHSGTVMVEISGTGVPNQVLKFDVSYTGAGGMTAYYLNEGGAP